MHDSRWDEGRDEDPDLERDAHEERELNAGGARAARVREQEDAADRWAGAVLDRLSRAQYQELDRGDGGCVVWLDGEAAYWCDEYGTAYEMHGENPTPLFVYAPHTAQVVEQAAGERYATR